MNFECKVKLIRRVRRPNSRVAIDSANSHFKDSCLLPFGVSRTETLRRFDSLRFALASPFSVYHHDLIQCRFMQLAPHAMLSQYGKAVATNV